MNKKLILFTSILFPSSAFSTVVLELDSSSLINPRAITATQRATYDAQGTLVDPTDTSTALSNVSITFTPEAGVPLATATSFIFDNAGGGHVENNSSSRWNSARFQNVDGSSVGTGLDSLGFRTSGAVETKGVLLFEFSQPVEDLALHLWNLDVGDVGLTSVNGSTTDFSAVRLSGNTLTSPASTVGDTLAPGTLIRSNDGSFQLTPTGGGPVSSIGLTIIKDGGSTDGWTLFLSGGAVVPEPSTAVLSCLALITVLNRRKRTV